MRVVNSLIVIILVGLGLILLHGAVEAAGSNLHSSQARANDPAIEFTDVVTITVLPSTAPYTPALTSYWQTGVYSFPGPNSFTVTLPSGIYSTTYSILSGTMSQPDPLHLFVVIPGSQANFFYNYYTNQAVKRLGNLFEVDQSFRANYSYRYMSTLVFSQPYQFSSALFETPTLQDPYTLAWDTIPVKDDAGFAVFTSSVWLIDPRLSIPDLEVLDLTSLNIAPPAGELKVFIRNSSAMTTGAPAYIEFYDQPSTSTFPINNPLIHDDGWCQGAPRSCPSSATFTNPIPSLAPGEVITLTTHYTFNNFGLRTFGVLIDAFGGPNGVISESIENNNWAYFSQGYFIKYLTDAVIDGPTSASANQPYSFTGSVNPTIAVSYPPLTYTWMPEPASGQSTTLATYQWSTVGVKTITLTVSNDNHYTVTTTHQINFPVIYLPLIRRN